MEDNKELSRRLYDVLENVGASEEMRQLHQHSATTMEILDTVMVTLQSGTGHVQAYYCGSSFEGSVTPDLASDIDIINCFSNRPVVADAQAAPPGLSYMIVRDDWTYPGYVKLQVMVDGQPLTADHGILLDGCTFSDTDTKGRIFQKHITLPNMHGPAGMYVDENGVHTIDQVPAFQCKSIPPFVLDCLSRPRPYGHSEELKSMAGLGCLFVGVGHVNSEEDEKDIEWRVSFSLQEKRLMASLNLVQHKVYLLLKMIKKDVLAKVLKDETLTSYHCKTCILYMVHMTPERCWTRDKITDCLLMSLRLLIKWIEKGNCPSYFVKHQNLFLKESFSRIRSNLLYLMHRLLEIGDGILYFIQSGDIGRILRDGDWRRYRDVTLEKKNAYVFKLKGFVTIRAQFCSVLSLHKLSRGRYDLVTIATALGALQRVETISNNEHDVTQSALSYLYPRFHLHIAKGLASLTYRHPDIVDHQKLMEIADFHFNEARGVDLVNERLARASILYRSNQYDECFLLLQQVDTDFVEHSLLYCPCTKMFKSMCYDMKDIHRRNKKTADLSIGDFMQELTATCVIFLPSELELAPAPLQYEMQRSLGTLPGSRSERDHHWYDWAVVDARVYLYFLQYLVSSKLHKDKHRNVAMDNIRAEIDRDDHQIQAGRESLMGHKDTACNLLGWIYMQEGRLAEASRCFTQSWRIRPYHNAAKFHMRDLIARMSGTQSNC